MNEKKWLLSMKWGAGFVEAACMYADAGVELILVDSLNFR